MRNNLNFGRMSQSWLPIYRKLSKHKANTTNSDFEAEHMHAYRFTPLLVSALGSRRRGSFEAVPNQSQCVCHLEAQRCIQENTAFRMTVIQRESEATSRFRTGFSRRRKTVFQERISGENDPHLNVLNNCSRTYYYSLFLARNN